MDFAWAAFSLGLGGVGWWLGRRSAIASHFSSINPVEAPSSPTSAPSGVPDTLLEQLRQTQLTYQMAREISQFKAGFLARTSHELRSPLNGLLGVHQLILADLCESPEEEREFIAQAHTSALKMVKILDEILDVAKLEHGSQTMEIQPVQLAAVLNETYQLTHLQAQNRNLRLQIPLPDPDLYVLADPRRLQQVLLSLVDMPISTMQEGDIQVSVQVDSAENWVHIRIEDDRPLSIWQEPLELLQSAQNQAVEITPDAVKATIAQPTQRSLGMTLLMVQTLLDLMHGHLELLSVPSNQDSQTTCVQCSLPIASDDS